MYQPQGSNHHRYQSFAPPPLTLPPVPVGQISSYGNNNPPQSQQPPPPSQDIVYISRSPIGRQEPTHESPWSTSIFGCFQDLKSCFVTAICPCITSGQVAEIVNEGKTSRWEGTILFLLFSMMLSGCFYTLFTRKKMRRLYKLKGSNVTDCMAHTFLLPCALCQEYRELNHQGFDPALGWRENIERQIHAVAVFRITPPPMEEEMLR